MTTVTKHELRPGEAEMMRIHKMADKFNRLEREWPDMHDLLMHGLESSIAKLHGTHPPEAPAGSRDLRALLELDLDEAMRLAAEIHWAAEKARKRAATKVRKAKRAARPTGRRSARGRRR